MQPKRVGTNGRPMRGTALGFPLGNCHWERIDASYNGRFSMKTHFQIPTREIVWDSILMACPAKIIVALWLAVYLWRISAVYEQPIRGMSVNWILGGQEYLKFLLSRLPFLS